MGYTIVSGNKPTSKSCNSICQNVWINCQMLIRNLNQIMVKKKLYKITRLLTYYMACTLLQGVLVFNLIQYKPLTLDKYVYPAWANGLGWILSGLPLFFIIFFMVSAIRKAPRNLTLSEVSISWKLQYTCRISSWKTQKYEQSVYKYTVVRFDGQLNEIR